MTPDFTLAVTKTCPKDGVHLWSRVVVANEHSRTLREFSQES